MKHSDSVTSMSISSRAGNNYSMYSDSLSLRPVTPEDSAYTNSVPSSPNKTLSTRDEASDHAVDFQGLGAGLARALSPEVLGRAGLALDEVIREIEEEGDDEVLVERSPIAVTPNNYSHPVRDDVCSRHCAALLTLLLSPSPRPRQCRHRRHQPTKRAWRSPRTIRLRPTKPSLLHHTRARAPVRLYPVFLAIYLACRGP